MIALIFYILAFEIIVLAACLWVGVWAAWQIVQVLLFLPLFIWHRIRAKKLGESRTPRSPNTPSPAWAWFRRVWLD